MPYNKNLFKNSLLLFLWPARDWSNLNKAESVVDYEVQKYLA